MVLQLAASSASLLSHQQVTGEEQQRDRGDPGPVRGAVRSRTLPADGQGLVGSARPPRYIGSNLSFTGAFRRQYLPALQARARGMINTINTKIIVSFPHTES